MEYTDLQTAVIVLLAICGGISVLGGAIKTLTDWTRPGSELAKTVRKHSELLDKDNERLTEMEEGQRIILRTLLTLVGHELDPENHTAALKQTESELQNFLIGR